MRFITSLLVVPGALLASAAQFSAPLLGRDALSADARNALDFSLARTRARYGWDTPAVEAKLKERAVGFIPLGNFQADTSYVSSIAIGDQVFLVVMDTGSSDLVVATDPCTGDCDSSLKRYTLSSTGTNLTTPFQITYGSGSASGYLVKDRVGLGGLSIADQTFAAATNFVTLVQAPLSGLLGLGFGELSNSGAVPLFEGLYAAGVLDAPEFGFAYSSLAATATQQTYNTVQPGGVITLGGTNSSLYSGSLNYVNVVNTGGYWTVPLDDIRVNGQSLGISSRAVVIDSGTSLVSVPSQPLVQIYNAISSQSQQAQELIAYPCNANPTVSFSFGGVYYDIPPENFAYGAADNSGTYCYGSIYDASQGQSQSTFIIGAAFLKNIYSSFRFEPAAVGFANLNDPNKILETGPIPVTADSAAGALLGQSGASAPSALPTIVSGSAVSSISNFGLGSVRSGAAQSSASGFNPVTTTRTATAAQATNTASSGSGSGSGTSSGSAGKLGMLTSAVSLALAGTIFAVAY